MPPKHYDDVRAAFDEGTVVNASKSELEQLLLAVGRARVLDPANQARAAEMGETMRQLLAARQSEEMHSQALRVSRVALWVSLAALIASLVQAAVSMNLVAALKEPVVFLSGTAAPPPKPASGGTQ
jgi:hypothetical protein